ncbi:MAG: Na/Pi cotransporter family protein, partial [Candidatus Sumerlaeota bacterium]
MGFGDWLELAFTVLGGLGIFLLGMKNMSEGMQAVAGDRLRKVIGAVTNNRFMACGIGALVTSVVQSSSVTTVMVVGMVNASIMTLHQAIGVILGANIGTTVTAWILTLKIGKYGLPIIGVTALIFLFSKRERLRYIAMAFLGLGMVFFGLELMKNGFSPLGDLPEFREWFLRFSPDSYFGVIRTCLVGALLTAIVQSSSATIGITMGLASQGLIDFPTAAALVLGENIGTTITALLASIGSTITARRAAYAHMLINVLGVLWITAIFSLYMTGVMIVLNHFDVYPEIMQIVDGEEAYPMSEKGIALTHTGFNVINAVIFLPLMGLITILLKRMVPDKNAWEKPHLSFLDVRMLDTPALGIQQSRNELLRMAENVKEMARQLRKAIDTLKPDEERDKEIFHLEEVTDIQQKEVVEFLSDLLSGNVPHQVMDTGRGQMRMADELETIAD